MIRPLVVSRPTIAITGSAGKTTTKEMIASILGKRWNIFKSKENMNTYWSTAKYKKQINSSHRAVVLEYGMMYKGQIKRHCQLIRPDIGVITNVGSAHIGHFAGKIRGIAAAKSELIRYMNPNGWLIVNSDDTNSRMLETGIFKGTVIKISQHENADYRASHIRYAKSGMSFTVKLNGQSHDFFIPILGKHNVYNALFAIAVSHRLGFTPQEIKAGLKSYKKPHRRLILHRLKRGITIIDDTYSANPHAMKAAVDVLSQVSGKRKIAVLGSMLEMGPYTAKGHTEIGKYLAAKKIDYLFTYGREAKQITRAAIKSGLSRGRANHFFSKEALHRKLVTKLIPETTLLIKGSNRIKLNETVKYLKNHFKTTTRQTAPFT